LIEALISGSCRFVDNHCVGLDEKVDIAVSMAAHSRGPKRARGSLFEKRTGKELLRRSPELKKVFSSAAATARTVPKEQSTAIAKEAKVLDKVQYDLANFRHP
jgi:hypothetical protein